MQTLSNLQARKLAGKAWNLNGGSLRFADYDPNEPGQPPWRKGSEGIAYPLLGSEGQPNAYVKFFSQVRMSPKRLERTRWLIEQRLHGWSPEMQGASQEWIDTRSTGRPHGVDFDFACSLAKAVPGRTWLEVKHAVACGHLRLEDGQRHRCVENLLHALTILDRNGFVHGDLSPGNVIIDMEAAATAPTLYVIDFDAFVAPHAGDLAQLSATEGGTFGTEGYCPAELGTFAQTDPYKAVPSSDRFARDMLLLELICFDSDCNFEEPPVKWNRDLLMSRVRASSLGKSLPHLQNHEVFQIDEKQRPETHELARAIGIAAPPRVKRQRVSRPHVPGGKDNLVNFLKGAESWLRRAIMVLWFLCLVHVAVVGFGVTGWLVGVGPTDVAIGGMLRLGARLFLTVGLVLAAIVPLSMLAFAERRERLIGVLGVWLRMPPRFDANRPELLHLGIVLAQLVGILVLLVIGASVMAVC